MVRALTSHQCSPGLIPRPSMWVEFVVASHPWSEGFSLVLPPQKPTLPNSNLIRNTWPHKLLALNTTMSQQIKVMYTSIVNKLLGLMAPNKKINRKASLRLMASNMTGFRAAFPPIP